MFGSVEFISTFPVLENILYYTGWPKEVEYMSAVILLLNHHVCFYISELIFNAYSFQKET